MSAGGGLDADAVFAVRDGRLCRTQVEVYLTLRTRGQEIEAILAARTERPVIDPGQALALVKTGLTESSAARFLFEMKMLFRNVCEREMSELQIVDDEA